MNKMNKAVEAGLDYWREMNQANNSWATFEAVQFKWELIVAVHVGACYHKGTENEFKEIPFKVRKFTCGKDGSVRYNDLPQV